MTVNDMIFGLRLSEYQRIVVKSYSREFGYIPLFGGYPKKAVCHVGNREIIGCDIINNCLHLKVKFQKDDII